jgi:dTDP-4-dehydrorhamnose reductase
VECSYLDVAGWRCDQLALTGHADRLDDLDRLADLGIKTVRYPVLWGRSGGAEATDWSWADARLGRLARLGVVPIIGLLHHGFGRIGVDPLDPGYPDTFAAFAAQVARRYPWVDAFLPVNEPLTTARFGGLYGWWPPYAHDDATFVRLVVAQCLAFRGAAKAIRQLRPDATIIVTEDAGRTYGTPELTASVDHANHRRWLTFDLLTGRVGPDHPLWSYLASAPDVVRGLELLRSEPSPPDMLGLNHYVTSDRFLDHRSDRYPPELRRQGAAVGYVDVESVRVAGYEAPGFRHVLDDTWTRYGLPIALTEVHLGAGPDDQAAWWSEAWSAALDASSAGIPVRGVTTWAAFGAWEWCHVLRQRSGSYEPGCFDGRSSPATETALAAVVANTARTGRIPDGPPGWWHRPERVRYGVDAPDPTSRAA